MKRIVSLVFILCIGGALIAQPTQQVTLRHWHPGPSGTRIQLFTQQQFIQYSRYEPTAPCRIDSVFMYFVSQNGGTSDLVMNIWEADGGSIGPHMMNQLTDSNVVRVTLQANGQAAYVWKLQKPVVLDPPRPFCVGLRNRDVTQAIAMVWDTTTQTPSCGNVDQGLFFTSAYGFWSPIQTGSQTQNLFFSGYVTYAPNDIRLMGNWLMDVYVTYFNIVGPTQKGFRDVTTAAGLGSLSGYRSQRIAWGDYDKDGYQDLLTAGKLFHNKGNGTFEDVTTATNYQGGSTVNLFVDLDNDGDLDIITQPVGKIYQNNNGVFTKLNDFGFEQSNNTTTMTAADYDNDKLPDIFVGNWERGDLWAKNPSNPNDSSQILSVGYKSHLYRNEGGMFFNETTDKLVGYEVEQLSQNPYTGAAVNGYRVVYGSGWSDFNNDGLMDLFVGCYRFQPNYLFVNQGGGNFIDDAERTTVRGHEKPTNTFAHTIGSDWGDYNNDGNMDLLVSNFSHPDWRHVFGDNTALYRNSGPPSYTFDDMQPGAGIRYEETHTDPTWGDYDNDGLLDFYITSTYACRHGFLYHQTPNNTFQDATYTAGTVTTNGWGVAWVDFDNDGDLDLAVTDETGFHLYRNEMHNSNTWSELRLTSKTGNDFAIGARATIYAGGRKLTREVQAGKGSGSQNPYVLHFGVGTGVFKIDSLTVRWPGGARDVWRNVPLNTILDVVEGGALPTAVASLPAPKSIELYQNYPNPFNPSTSISFDLSAASRVRIDIFNMYGANVRTLTDRSYDPGTYTVNWDGADDAGRALAGGSYIYRMTAGEKVIAKRMVLLK